MIKPPFQTMLGGRVTGRPEWEIPWLRQGSVIIQRGCNEPDYRGLAPTLIIADEAKDFDSTKSNFDLEKTMESIINDRVSFQRTFYPIERKRKMFRFPWTKKIKEAEIRATSFSNACEQWQRNAFAWQKTDNERTTKMEELQSKVWALEAKIGDLTAVQRKWRVRMSDGVSDFITATEAVMENNVLVFKDHGKEVARFRGECVICHIEIPLTEKK